MKTLAIESTPIWSDVQDILNSNFTSIDEEIKILIHTEKEDFTVIKLLSLDISRNYNSHIGDVIFIDFVIGLGDYVYRLLPYIENMEVSIKTVKLTPIANKKKTDTKIIVDRYKALFDYKSNPNFSIGEMKRIDSETLNKADLVTVKLQLLDRSVETFRIKQVRGIYSNVTQHQLLHSLISGESRKILIDGKPCLDALDIKEPSNTQKRAHVVIQDGVNLASLPTYLQEKEGGVYNAGIGSYIQRYDNKKTMFVFPLYDVNRFDTKDVRCIFYIIPKNKLPGVEKTILRKGDTYHILITNDVKIKDAAEIDLMESGVGFRMSDAKAFMKKPVQITEDGPVALRSNLNYEVSLFDRGDGLNYAPVSKDHISSNPFTKYSQILLKTLSRIDMAWENADCSIIYPGMPCMVTMMDNDKLVKIKGIIQGTHSFKNLQGTAVTGRVYKTIAGITVLSESYRNKPSLISYQASGDY